MTHDNTNNKGPKDVPEHIAGLDALDADLERFKDIELDESLAAELNDFMALARNTGKEIDADRKAIKEPFFQGGKAVDARFKPLTDRAKQMVVDAKAILTPYIVEQARIAQEAQEKAEAEAREKERVAQLLKGDAIAGDMVAEEAETAAKAVTLAKAQTDNAGRVGSASGYARAASLRTFYDAVVTDAKLAAIHYADHPKMTDLLVQLAQADMRGDEKKTLEIAGIKFNRRQVAA